MKPEYKLLIAWLTIMLIVNLWIGDIRAKTLIYYQCLSAGNSSAVCAETVGFWEWEMTVWGIRKHPAGNRIAAAERTK